MSRIEQITVHLAAAHAALDRATDHLRGAHSVACTDEPTCADRALEAVLLARIAEVQTIADEIKCYLP